MLYATAGDVELARSKVEALARALRHAATHPQFHVTQAELSVTQRAGWALALDWTLGGFIGALGLIALLVFVAVAMHELQYASDHPFAYGPAKVIASGAGAGAVLSTAVALVGVALSRLDQ